MENEQVTQASVNEGSVHEEQPMPQQSLPEGEPSREQLREAAQRAVREKQEAAEGAVRPAEPEKPATNYEALHTKALVDIGKKDLENRRLKEQMKALETQLQEHQSIFERLKDPEQSLEALKAVGTSYSELTNHLVSAEKPPLTPEQEEIRDLKEQVKLLLTDREQREKERQAYQVRQTQQTAENYAKELIEKNAEKYPFLRASEGHVSLVREYQRLMQETGQTPDEHEVAAHLEERYRVAAEKRLSSFVETGIIDKSLEALGYVRTRQNQHKPANGKDSSTNQRQPTLLAGNMGSQQASAQVPTLTNELSATPDSGFDYEAVLKKDKIQRDRELRERARREAAKRGTPL